MTDISKQLNRPDHLGMRRFSLAMGLLLVGYSIAGISLEPDPAVSLLGIPFRLSRPQLLPYVLAAATLYGLLRYYYYCILLTRTPYSVRRDLLNRLVRHIRLKDGFSVAQLHSFGVYHGPIEFELGPQRPWMYRRDRHTGESEPAQEQPAAWSVTPDANGIPVMPAEGVEFQKDLDALFPAFGRARVATRWNYQSAEPPMQVRLHVVIPNRCRLAAIFEDIDYLAPIWLNMLAIVVFVWSRLAR
jgi:hypothetical protein